MTSPRIHTIDALRGIALFGILAVNIQSAAWSLGGPTLGQFDEMTTTLDRVALLFTAFFLEFKFYPIFCFCFGYGFAVQARKWILRGQDAGALFVRRLMFMLLFGIFHGVFLWFGDILARYALTGFILRYYLGKGPRELIGAIEIWAVLTFAATLMLGGLISVGMTNPVELANMNATVMTEIAAAKTIYTTGSYIEITRQRTTDFAAITASFIYIVPQIMLLFLLGALTSQMGWLKVSEQSPRKHHALLKRIFTFTLAVGLPINIAYTMKAWAMAHTFTIDTSLFDLFVSTLAPIFAFTYISGLALIANARTGKILIALFAPAGKIALTNYVFQSLVMSFVLYGYGLGLGARLRQGELLLLAIAIFVLQLTLSHLYLRVYRQGPLEWMWRRWTNAPQSR
jgi:uncharacterized protein